MTSNKSLSIWFLALSMTHSTYSANIFRNFTSRILDAARAAILSRSQTQRMAIGAATGTGLFAGTGAVNAQKDLPVEKNSDSSKDTPEYVPLIVMDSETDKQIPIWFDRRFSSPLIGIEMVLQTARFNNSISIISAHHAWWDIWGPTFKRQELALPLNQTYLEKYYDRDKQTSVFYDLATAPLKLYNVRQASSDLQRFAQERYGKDIEKVEFYDDKNDLRVHAGIKLLLLKLSESAVTSPVKNHDQIINTSYALGSSRLWVDSKFRKIVGNDATMKSLGFKPGIIKCSKGSDAICVAVANGTKLFG